MQRCFHLRESVSILRTSPYLSLRQGKTKKLKDYLRGVALFLSLVVGICGILVFHLCKCRRENDSFRKFAVGLALVILLSVSFMLAMCLIYIKFASKDVINSFMASLLCKGEIRITNNNSTCRRNRLIPGGSRHCQAVLCLS